MVKARGDKRISVSEATINKREAKQEEENKWRVGARCGVLKRGTDNEESCPETGYKQEHNNIIGMKTLSLHNKDEYGLLYRYFSIFVNSFRVAII